MSKAEQPFQIARLPHVELCCALAGHPPRIASAIYGLLFIGVMADAQTAAFHRVCDYWSNRLYRPAQHLIPL